MRHRAILPGLAGLIILCAGLIWLIPVPYNPFWQLFNGVYTYDPRSAGPPQGLVSLPPETSLQYYLDATLAACAGVYPPVSPLPVERYEIEQVIYDGRSSYHAFSLVSARLFYAHQPGVLVTFRFEAGHNEGDVMYLEYGSTVRAGSWLPVGALVRDAHRRPPGGAQWMDGTTCAEVGIPYRIQR